MYQTVGHHAIDLYAEAMALPLYRRTIRGRSLDIGQVYTECEGDEVEDLFQLLKLIKVCRVTSYIFLSSVSSFHFINCLVINNLNC
jgi:diphthine-ammonia ligase